MVVADTAQGFPHASRDEDAAGGLPLLRLAIAVNLPKSGSRVSKCLAASMRPARACGSATGADRAQDAQGWP